MTWKQKWKPALLLCSAALSLSLLAVAAPASAALKYPDLRPLPAADLHLGTEPFNGENHYVIRFSTYMSNLGEGPMEFHGSPHFPPDGTFDVDQWAYDDASGFTSMRVGTFYFHRAPGHNHFHFDDFARYELWTQGNYERAVNAGFASGRPLVKSKKISFCVEDSQAVASNASATPMYRTVPCSPAMQGISVGWADLYDYGLSDQWVDVGQIPLADGAYVIRIVGDPSNKIYESTSKADPSREGEVANSSARYFTILKGRLAP
jgi:hypothetical protein